MSLDTDMDANTDPWFNVNQVGLRWPLSQPLGAAQVSPR